MTVGRLRFDGWIAGIGTTSGTRVVLGHWPRSPFGPFSDVMVEQPDGTRVLLAGDRRVAAFIADTYVFDEIRLAEPRVDVAGPVWSVTAGPLALRFAVGPRGALGMTLRAVPAALAVRPAWTRVTDPLARRFLGVATRGEARAGRRECYGVVDLRPVVAADAHWAGVDLGRLAPVRPPVRFGFASVPARPVLVRVTTTVEPGASGPG